MYIVGRNWDFGWNTRELKHFNKLWRSGVPILNIADALQRPDYEVALLVMDLAERGRIISRNRGAG